MKVTPEVNMRVIGDDGYEWTVARFDNASVTLIRNRSESEQVIEQTTQQRVSTIDRENWDRFITPDRVPSLAPSD